MALDARVTHCIPENTQDVSRVHFSGQLIPTTELWKHLPTVPWQVKCSLWPF